MRTKKHQIEIIPYSIGVRNYGAGNGNRTRNLTLARLCFTTKLYLQLCLPYRKHTYNTKILCKSQGNKLKKSIK